MTSFDQGLRVQGFGAPRFPMVHDGRLSWCLLLNTDPQGVAMWGVPWSMEVALRALFDQTATGDTSRRTFEDWMMNLPSNESPRFENMFLEPVDDVEALGASTTLSKTEAMAYLQRLHEQVAQRLGLMPDQWAGPTSLLEAQRPERRVTRTMFVDEALVEYLARHVHCAVERRVLIDAADREEPQGVLVRPRL